MYISFVMLRGLSKTGLTQYKTYRSIYNHNADNANAAMTPARSEYVMSVSDKG